MDRYFLFAFALLVIGIDGQTRDIPVTMGNLAVHYNLKSIVSTVEHPLNAGTSGPIWCQATLNEVPLPINSSTFVRYNDHKRRRFSPQINHTTLKASLDIEPTVFENMGKYRCEITINENEESSHTVFGNLMVYSRPFFHTNSSLHLVTDEQNKNLVNAGKLYATEGDRLVVVCPALGYPKPSITWYKDTEVLDSSERVHMNGTQLIIDEFAESDEGVYRCTATNQYPMKLDIDVQTYEASLEYDIQIGSPYGWLYPLLLIIVMLLLLFVIIYACAACKKYQHDNYNVAKREKLLRTPSLHSNSGTSIRKHDYI